MSTHRAPGHRGAAESDTAAPGSSAGRGSHRGKPAEDALEIADKPSSHRGAPAAEEPRGRRRGAPAADETSAAPTPSASAAGKHAKRVIAAPVKLAEPVANRRISAPQLTVTEPVEPILVGAVGTAFEVDPPESLTEALAEPRAARRRRHSLGRALRWTAASVLVPGLGHLLSGRRKLGAAIVAAFGTLLLTAAVLLLAVPHSRWVSMALRPHDLVMAMTVCGVLGALWMLVVASSWWVARPKGLGTAQRVIGTSVAATLSLGVAAPFAFGARTAYVQYDLLHDIFSAAPVPLAPTPRTAAKPAGFGPSHGVFAGKQRVNVLLLGGDGGKDRTGVRTDSMILASIDTLTGSTVLISLPRNMMQAPFLPGTPMAKRYPNGFDDMLNAVYRYGTEHPEVMPGTPFPGGELIKQSFAYTIGQTIDYFVLVNLGGFEDLVNAIGGVTMTVPRPLPIGGRHDGNNKVLTPPTGYLQPGHRKLSGYEALWYGRSRFDSDDYSRMARQRCLLTAIAHQASPFKVLTNFSTFANAAKQIILTDIPQDALPELFSLASKAKSARITDVSIVRNALFDPAHPDFAYVQQQVKAGLDAAAAAPQPAKRPATVVAASRDTSRKPKPTTATAKAPTAKPATAKAPAAGFSCDA